MRWIATNTSSISTKANWTMRWFIGGSRCSWGKRSFLRCAATPSDGCRDHTAPQPGRRLRARSLSALGKYSAVRLWLCTGVKPASRAPLAACAGWCA